METKANYVAVGAFVLICIIGLVVAVLWLAGAQYSEEFADYRAYFPGPVTGLGKGTVVRYNGIDIGNVKDVNFDPDDPKRVAAILQIDQNLRLHNDSTVSIESQGLTGGIYVEITGGTKNAPYLAAKPGEDLPVIPSKQSAIQQLYESMPQLLQRLNTLAERGGDMLNDENRKALAETFNNLRDVSGTINRHSADIEATLSELSTTVKQMNQALVSADDAARKLATLGSDAGDAVKKISLLAGHADDVVQKGAVAQLDELIVRTRALVTSLTRLSNEIERQPTQLIFGDRRQGYAPQ